MMFGAGARLGPYEVLSSLFEAGAEAAYLARDHDHQRDVVLRVVSVDFAADPARLHRFEHDTRIALTLAHPNILTLYDIGTDAQTAYIVAEPADGEKLRSLLDRGALSMRAAMRYAVDVARALWAARGTHLVHGDLSADTVLVTSTGAKVLDLGLGAVTRRRPARSDASAFAALVWKLATTSVRSAVSGVTPAGRRRVALAAIALAALAVALIVMPASTDQPRPATTAPAPPIETPVTPVASSPSSAPEPPQAIEIARAPVTKPRAAPATPVAAPAPVVTTPAARTQPPPAPPVSERDRATLTMEASVRVAEFDLAGAAKLLQTSTQDNGGDAIEALYISGLVDAREAFRRGGSAESLVPVAAAITSLAKISQGRPGRAEIARLILQAAGAAAQTERDEMRLYLEVATQMEALQHEAGQPGAPLVSAAEAAGDLWLQVHDYEKAQRAYMDAMDRVGSTLRILYGLARSARGLNDADAACMAYRQLLSGWGQRPGSPPEIAEARTYVAACAPLR